jgi:branched-chain amino acid transport system substrate-binding protein
MGSVKFGRNGEWAEPRVLQVQFQGAEGYGLAQFQQGRRQVVVWPPEHRSGSLIYPFEAAVDS